MPQINKSKSRKTGDLYAINIRSASVEWSNLVARVAVGNPMSLNIWHCIFVLDRALLR